MGYNKGAGIKYRKEINETLNETKNNCTIWRTENGQISNDGGNNIEKYIGEMDVWVNTEKEMGEIIEKYIYIL